MFQTGQENLLPQVLWYAYRLPQVSYRGAEIL
jgi:hypothetical protein